MTRWLMAIAVFLLANSISAQNTKITKWLPPNSAQLDTAFFGKVEGINYGYMEGGDGVLDKPAIILEGFDPFNETDYVSVYGHWSKSPITSSLYYAGYDVIAVDFVDNHCSVVQNAAYVKRLIELINQKKTGRYEGLLMGESMGGIIGRVALSEMEKFNQDHQMRLFVALDSPFKGANIPIAVQYMLSDLEKLDRGLVNEAFEKEAGYDITVVKQALNSVAAQQLVTYHIADSSHYYFSDFQNYFSELGYPQATRNIAFVNGSNTAADYDFNPGDKYFALSEGWSPILKIEAECYMVDSNNPNQLVSSVKDWNFWNMRKPRKDFEHYFASTTNCYDNAPGGYLDKLSFSTEGVDYFCFVPTSSAIDLDGDLFFAEGGLHYFDVNKRSKDDLIDSGLTPFDDIYCNAENSKHAKIYLIPDLEGFVKREFMFDAFFLQNEVVSKSTDYTANDSIVVGRDVNPFTKKNINTGNVLFEKGIDINMSSKRIVLKPGVDIKSDCIIKVRP